MGKVRPLLGVAAAHLLCCSSCYGGAAADAVAESCDAIRDFVDVSFCASRLRSVPGAAAVDGTTTCSWPRIWRPRAGPRRVTQRRRCRATPTAAPAALDALEACGIQYGAASVPALRLMRGYAAARSWGTARTLLPLTGHGRGAD